MAYEFVVSHGKSCKKIKLNQLTLESLFDKVKEKFQLSGNDTKLEYYEKRASVTNWIELDGDTIEEWTSSGDGPGLLEIRVAPTDGILNVPAPPVTQTGIQYGLPNDQAERTEEEKKAFDLVNTVGDCDEMLDDAVRKRVNSRRVDIIQTLASEVDGLIIDHLIEMESVNAAKVASIKAKNTPHDRARELLDHILNGPKSRFAAFCRAVINEGSHHIVTTMLMPTPPSI